MEEWDSVLQQDLLGIEAQGREVIMANPPAHIKSSDQSSMCFPEHIK